MAEQDAAAEAPLPFSDELEAWLSSSAPKTLGGLGDVFAERSFAVAVLILMLPAALPLPTGGVTHVLEVVAIILGAEMVLGRSTIWVPRRWAARELGASVTGKALPRVAAMVRWLERHSRPRGVGLLGLGVVSRILGLAVIGLALGAGLAPPFSGLDTLPALGSVVLCLGIILGDLVVVLAGLVIGLIGIALSVALGAAVIDFFKRFFR